MATLPTWPGQHEDQGPSCTAISLIDLRLAEATRTVEQLRVQGAQLDMLKEQRLADIGEQVRSNARSEQADRHARGSRDTPDQILPVNMQSCGAVSSITKCAPDADINGRQRLAHNPFASDNHEVSSETTLAKNPLLRHVDAHHLGQRSAAQSEIPCDGAIVHGSLPPRGIVAFAANLRLKSRDAACSIAPKNEDLASARSTTMSGAADNISVQNRTERIHLLESALHDGLKPSGMPFPRGARHALARCHRERSIRQQAAPTGVQGAIADSSKGVT